MRDLQTDYGCWSNAHRRFIRWRDKGVWERLLEKLIDAPDYEWLMIDARHIKVHPHAAGAKAVIENEPLKRGLNTKVNLAVDANGTPLRIIITEGTTADCTQASKLIDGMTAMI